jgi:hypothetical protein
MWRISKEVTTVPGLTNLSACLESSIIFSLTRHSSRLLSDRVGFSPLQPSNPETLLWRGKKEVCNIERTLVAKMKILNWINPTSETSVIFQHSLAREFLGRAVCCVVETPAEAREALPNAAHVVSSHHP